MMFPQHFTGKSPPPGHVYKYNKTGSRADMAGELYEVKMTLLLFLRGINSTAGFYLASNVDGAGAFDDILFKFKPLNATDTFKTCFLQLKHKQRKPVLHETEKKKTKPLTMEGLYSNNGDFSLGKYHESYCEVADRMKMSTESDDIMFNGSFEDTWFVIYTNAPVVRKLLNHEKTEEYSNPDRNILSSGGDNEFIFYFHEEDAINYKPNKKIPSDLNNSKKEFLDSLKIYCGQASETELNTFIELEVQCALQTSNDITKSIAKDLTSRIADWWRDSSDVLTETSFIWQEIITARIETINVSIRKYLNGFNVSYNTQILHSFYLSLNNSPVVFVNGADTTLTSLKVLQTLDSYYTKQFIFIDLKSLLLKKPEVLCLWQSSWCHVLVVDCSLNDAEVELEDLANDLTQASQGKLILIVKNSIQTFPNVINHTLIADRCMHMEDLFSFKQLDSESQTQIMDTEVIFQGIAMSLGSVVKENTEDISGNILGQLLTPHYKLSIGPRLDDLISYYIPRRLKRFDCLKNDILNSYRKEYFVISSALEREIQEILPYGEKLTLYEAGVTGITSHFLLANQFFSEQDFVNVCLHNQNKSFHWLTFDGDSLVWKQSNNVALIRENLDSDRYSIHSSARNVVDDRVVLVTAEPGMGKSTLVTHLAKQVQEDDPSLWIIRVNLNDTTALLEKIDYNYFTDIDNTIQFLLLATIAFEKSTEGINEGLETKLFKSRLKTFENVAIFLDGFDEISPDFTNEVISLLKCLMKTKVKKLWVTSRNVMCDTLEMALSLISYKLQPFTVDDQHSFLICYWNSIMHVDVREQLKQFAVLLLEVTSKSLNDHEKEFTSIPLQTFMLAESFEQEMTRFFAEGINCLPTRLNLLDLYERFIEKKQNVYYKDKAKWDTSKVASRREIQRLKKLFICNHMNAALLLLLSAEQLQELDSFFTVEDANDFLEDIANVDEKRGIIDGMIGNKPHFIHRTFAEYFLALWLSQHFNNVNSFIQNYLFNENYQTIRYFFDCILTKGCKFHNAVLSGDKEYFQFFLSKEPGVNLHDKGNRTPLHIAVSYPDLELSVNQGSVQTILDHGAHVNSVDTVLQWTPLRYADATKSWSHIDKLLCKGGNQEDLVKTKQNICDGEMLCKAAEQGYLKLMAFVLDCDVDVNIIVRPRENSTLLHMAAEVGNIQSVNFLISKGANVDSHDISSRTPLHLAAFKGHLPVIESLVNRGGDVMCQDEEHATPLHWASSYGHIEVVKYLVGKGADIMSCSADYLTPLHLASGSGHLSIVQFLKEKGADIISRDLYGTTPLQEAAECGRLDVVNFLVESGADVNTCDTGHKTPLHWACRSGHLPVAEFLVIKGADVMSQTTDVTEPLHWAADMGHESVVMFLLEKGANIDARDEHGATPLLLAAGNGYLKVVECLVCKGASVKLSKRDGQSPLQLASAKGHLPIVCFLMDNGADVMSQSECGNTPLHSAAQYGHLEVVQYLVGKGALINAKDNESQTTLELANICQQWDTVQWLTAVSNTNALADCHISDETKQFFS